MKKKTKKVRATVLSVIAATGIATLTITGCGGAATQNTKTETQQQVAFANELYKGQTVTGKIVSVEGNNIEISSGENGESSDSDTSLTFEVSDDTKYSSQGAGTGDGQAPGGTPPAKPGGENSDGEGASDGQSQQGTPPAKPEGESSGDGQAPQGTPPAKPEGESSGDGQEPQGTPPSKPDGESSGDSESSAGASSETGSSAANQGEQPPEKSGGESKDITKDDLKTGDEVSIEIDDAGKVTSVVVKGGMSVSPGGAPGGSANVEYTAVKTVEEDTELTGETINSTGDEENGLLVKNGAKVTFAGGTITRSSQASSGGDNASFYGLGAAALVTDGELYVSDSTIETDAEGGAGVFAYGDGTAYVENTKITTKLGSSGGIHVAGGGILYASNLDVETSGGSSAAIRSDRGGGTMEVDGGTYTSNGKGSPAIYSTADIKVNNATLTANGSEAICIEGKNSIRLTNCNLTGNMSDDEQNDHTWNVILYQSMSGDSEVGNSVFTMDGGTLTAKNGGMFYSTNTESTFVLKDVDITYADDSEYFLRVSGNANKRGWGSSGSNGADTSFTAISQEMKGKVIWDSISTLDMYMIEGSELTGSIEKDDTYAGGGSGGKCSIYISSDSTWTVTGDSEVTNLYNAGTITDTSGKAVTVKDTTGNVLVQGDSEYTITVGSYSETVDLSCAGTL